MADGIVKVLLYVGAVGVIIAPGLAGAAAWYRVVRTPSVEARTRLWFWLSLSSLSYIWLLSGLLAPDVIGAEYSRRRFATIWINIGGSLLLLGWALTRIPTAKKLLVAFGITLAVAWGYVLLVSASV
jgi:hypothetical protein